MLIYKSKFQKVTLLITLYVKKGSLFFYKFTGKVVIFQVEITGEDDTWGLVFRFVNKHECKGLLQAIL